MVDKDALNQLSYWEQMEKEAKIFLKIHIWRQWRAIKAVKIYGAKIQRKNRKHEVNIWYHFSSWSELSIPKAVGCESLSCFLIDCPSLTMFVYSLGVSQGPRGVSLCRFGGSTALSPLVLFPPNCNLLSTLYACLFLPPSESATCLCLFALLWLKNDLREKSGWNVGLIACASLSMTRSPIWVGHYGFLHLYSWRIFSLG